MLLHAAYPTWCYLEDSRATTTRRLFGRYVINAIARWARRGPWSHGVQGNVVGVYVRADVYGTHPHHRGFRPLQLNFYGFKKSTKVRERNHWEFYHSHFVRGRLG